MQERNTKSIFQLEVSPRVIELWGQLEPFSFDHPDSSFLFSERLARENGWSQSFSERVIIEYKMFACLIVLTGDQLTPSDPIDQAWHLHLTYTRNYWIKWSELLGKSIHHSPTSGGETEAEQFLINYQHTLTAYQNAFRIRPPVDIWPPAHKRFNQNAQFVRLDTSKYIIWNKPW